MAWECDTEHAARCRSGKHSIQGRPAGPTDLYCRGLSKRPKQTSGLVREPFARGLNLMSLYFEAWLFIFCLLQQRQPNTHIQCGHSGDHEDVSHHYKSTQATSFQQEAHPNQSPTSSDTQKHKEAYYNASKRSGRRCAIQCVSKSVREISYI